MQRSKQHSNGARLQRFHFWLGVVAGLYFLILALSGVALNHRAELGMEERFISHRYLPSNYRPRDEGERTRMDIVLADLHSGLLFGKYGPWINDGIALALVTSTLSGFALTWLRRRSQWPVPAKTHPSGELKLSSPEEDEKANDERKEYQPRVIA